MLFSIDPLEIFDVLVTKFVVAAEITEMESTILSKIIDQVSSACVCRLKLMLQLTLEIGVIVVLHASSCGLL